MEALASKDSVGILTPLRFPPGVCSVTQMKTLASKDHVGMLTPLQGTCPPLFPIGHRVLGGLVITRSLKAEALALGMCVSLL